MLNSETRDFVVIGAGVAGLSVAVELAGRGHDVVCLEQSSVGHEWSGSKGGSRLFHFGYDDPAYVQMAFAAFDGWRRLQERAGEQLLWPCSLLNYGIDLTELADGMSAGGASSELLAADDVAGRYPGLAIPGDALLDEAAGVLSADRVLAALAEALGADLRQQSSVRTVEDVGRAVRVRTADGPIEASAVIVCAGAASEKLLSAAGIPCRLVPSLEQVAYFSVEPASLPAVAQRVGPSEAAATGEIGLHVGVYGLPVPKRGQYKLGLHRTGPIADLGRTSLESDPMLLKRLVSCATELIRGVSSEPKLVERCVYDNTGDGHFVVDRVGRIVVGAGTSGHGFKFAPALGGMLADLATEANPAPARFSLSRPIVSGVDPAEGSEAP